MENKNKSNILLPGGTVESAEALQKKGFWATVPNKKQFVGGVAMYLVGLVLALICSSTQLLAEDASATVRRVYPADGAENMYTIEYSFTTAKGVEQLRSYNYWTINPERDLAREGDVFDTKYMPFLPSTDGTESAYPILMFVGILLFFGGWTMTKGRAPIVQTRKVKRDRAQEERTSKYYYPPEENYREADSEENEENRSDDD